MKLSEAIYNGLTNLGESLTKINKERQQHQLESWDLGLVPDETRLRILKQQLYRDARLNKDTEELRKTIELLSSDEVFVERDYPSMSNLFMNVILTSVIGLWGFNLLHMSNKFCSNKQSEFCNQINEVNVYLHGEDTNLLPDNTGK